MNATPDYLELLDADTRAWLDDTFAARRAKHGTALMMAVSGDDEDDGDNLVDKGDKKTSKSKESGDGGDDDDETDDDEEDDDDSKGSVSKKDHDEAISKYDARIKRVNKTSKARRIEIDRLTQENADLRSGKIKQEEKDEWVKTEAKRIRDEVTAEFKKRETAISALTEAGWTGTLSRGLKLLDLADTDEDEIEDAVDDLKKDFAEKFRSAKKKSKDDEDEDDSDDTGNGRRLPRIDRTEDRPKGGKKMTGAQRRARALTG